MSPRRAALNRPPIDPALIPGQDRAGGGAIVLRVFLVLVAVFGAGLTIALVTT